MILLTTIWIIVFTGVKNWVWSEAEIGFQRRRGIVSGLAIHEMCIHYFWADLAYAKNGEDWWTHCCQRPVARCHRDKNRETRLPTLRCAQGRRQGGRWKQAFLPASPSKPSGASYETDNREGKTDE